MGGIMFFAYYDLNAKRIEFHFLNFSFPNL